MARVKTRNNVDPYPSSPTRPPLYNIWLKYGAEHSRMQIHCYCTDWAAWISLKIALNGRKYELVDPAMGWYETDDGDLRFRIIEPDGEDILKSKPDHDWLPGEPNLSQLKLAAGIISEPSAPKSTTDAVRETNKSKTKTRATTTVKRDGLISIGDICTELGIQPRDARKMLRGKVEKPDQGWAWPESEVAAIKKLLK